MEVFMYFLIAILVAVLLTVVVSFNNTIKELKEKIDNLKDNEKYLENSINSLKSVRKDELEKITSLNTELYDKIAIINQYKRTIDNRTKTLVNDIYFEDLDGIEVMNVKVKKDTINDIPTLLPTIRRKVSGTWTEIPVTMKYRT